MAALDVLHVCFGGLGGHQAVVNPLSNEFAKLGLTSGVLGISTAQTELVPNSSWSHASYVEQVRIKRRVDLGSHLAVYRQVRRLKPRVVFLHSHRPALAVALAYASMRRRPPIVMVEHHSIALRSLADNLYSLLGLIFSSSIVLLTRQYFDNYPLRYFVKLKRQSPIVIPTGIDTQTFDRSQTKNSTREGPYVIGTANRLVPSKDLTTLLQAFAVLHHEYGGQWVLRIAGDGIEMKSLVAFVHELGLAESVVFLGQIAEPLMPEFFGQLDVYVLSTLGETLNTSILQAAASRIPIVATDVTGVADIFTNRKEAILVSPRDPSALAAAISEVAGNPSIHYMVNAAFRKVNESFSSTQMSEGYVEVIRTADPHVLGKRLSQGKA